MGKKKDKAKSKKGAPVAVAGQGAIAVNQYDSAGTGRRLRGWSTPAVGPNRSLAGLQNIRNRARDAGRNEWAGKAARRRWSANLVGTGILAYPKTRDKDLRERLLELWDDWAEECDADGVYNLYGLQALITGNWFEAGEVFVRLRWRRLSDGLPAPLQLQVLEADMVPMLDTDYGPGLPRGHYIRSGIEFDPIGHRVAYWMHREHPGDGHGSGSIGL
ncbi:MAG TPA: phage portal protein, partial [Azoarcus taiwanensis]|nr:phage portal protein [Azoarcus taiwanensis]